MSWMDFLSKGSTWTTVGSIVATIIAVVQHKQGWATALPSIILAISSLFNAAHVAEMKAQLRAKGALPPR